MDDIVPYWLNDILLLFVTFPSAYVEWHCQLPNDEWNSDTEYEQKPISPGEELPDDEWSSDTEYEQRPSSAEQSC